MNITQFICPCCHWRADLDFKISDADKQAILGYLRDQLFPIEAIIQVSFHSIGNWFGIYVHSEDCGADVSGMMFSAQYELERKFPCMSFESNFRLNDSMSSVKKMEHGEAGIVFAR